MYFVILIYCVINIQGAVIAHRYVKLLACGAGYISVCRPFLAQLVDDDRIRDIPYNLLGPDFVYEGSGAHYHVGDTPWHGGSGIITWPLPHIKVSLYLDELRQDNSCLRVIPGSHRNYLRHVDSRWA